MAAGSPGKDGRNGFDLPETVGGITCASLQVLGQGLGVGFAVVVTHRPHSSSFLGGVPYRILNINYKKELLWSLWVKLIRFNVSLVCFSFAAYGVE